jgi:hypothetical protein
MARITEKRFAALTVQIWRLIQQLEKLKAKEKIEGILGPTLTVTRSLYKEQLRAFCDELGNY